MTIHLSIMLALPAAAGLLGLAGRRAAGWVAFVGSLLAFAYSFVLLIDFDAASGALQYVTDERWIEQIGIHYMIGVEGIIISLILWKYMCFTD